MRRNVIIGSALVVLCAVVAMVSVGGSFVNKVTFADLPQRAGQPCEIYGKLDPASIKPIKGANLVQFALIEEKTNARLPVLYDNINSALPANFPAASHAKVSGFYNAAEGRFVGSAVTTKCPSKYDKGNPDMVRNQPFIEKWQRETGQRSE
jgi:cytochrome c-type biogenesis protein CcmE